MGFFLLVAGVGMGGGGSGSTASGRIRIVAYQFGEPEIAYQFGTTWIVSYQWGCIL